MPEVERLDLRAVDRTDARFLRGVPETHRAIEAVRVGERERIHPSLDRGLDKFLHVRGAIEEAVIGVTVELDVFRHVICSPAQ